MQKYSRHTEARSQDTLTCKTIQDTLETQDKTRHIEEGHDKAGQKVTKWRGGCREESRRREMTRGSGGVRGGGVGFVGEIVREERVRPTPWVACFDS